MIEIFPVLATGAWPAVIAVTILVITFVLFFTEFFPTEVTALLAAIAMLASGLIDMDEALSALSNPAPWTIAAMFILSGALVRTGVLNELTALVTTRIKTSPVLVISVGVFFVLTLSAFMNNTPVVLILMPIVIQVASDLGKPASRFLIPLSYLAIMGGMMTLIGTSTNLLVDGVARDAGLEPFHLFEITPLAAILAVGGLVYILVAGPFLLPERTSMANALVNRKRMSFFTEVAVPVGSPIIGDPLKEVDLFRRDGMRVIDVLRGDESLRRDLGGVELAAGDRIVLKTGVNELLSLKESRAIALVDKLSERKTKTVEALISPGCNLVGRKLGDLRLRRRYGVYPLALHRRSQNIGRQLDDVIIRVGDTLLLEGAQEDIQRLSIDANLLDLTEPTERSYRRSKAPYAIGAWVGVVVLAALNILPLLFGALVAIGFVLAIKAIDVDEALNAIEGSLMLLIFAMLAVGQGLQNSGAIEALAGAIAPLIANLPPSAIIAIVFLMTSVLTEMISNNAIAVVMTPVAIGLADAVGVDARPLVVAVMIAASCAFSTPIGYQTNTMVYGPGGYKFTDFMKFGLPLNALFWVMASLLIPVFFPF